MKKITLLLVITFTFLFSTTSWGEWTYVTESVDGHKSYYDKDRVRKSGKYLYFWELVDYIKPRSVFGNLSTTSYTQLDCSIFRYKNLKLLFYTNSMGEGKMIDEVTPPDEWHYIPPKSVIDGMYTYICEEHQ